MSNKQTRAQRHASIQSRARALAASTVVQAAAADTSESETHGELWLYGVVGGYWWGFNASSVAEQLKRLDVDHLTVRVHSPGGDALDGIAIANLLRNHKARVSVVVDGLAASAASVIALAGDEVVMSPGAQFMIHDPWMVAVGSASELREDATFLDGQAANYAAVYHHAAPSKTAAEWRDVMLADTWFNGDDAVAAGLADRVGTVTSTSTPPEAPESEDLDESEMAARAAWDLDVLVHPAARAAWRTTAPKPPSASAVGTTHTEGGPAMAFSPEQLTTMRAELGLPETADEATIVAALSEALEERAEVAPASTVATVTVPPGMSLVETDVLTSLRQGATDGTAALTALRTQERDTAINAAVTDGRITPARKDHWVKSWKADPEGTATMLAALEPGLAVATTELGSDEEPSAAADDLDAVRATPAYKNWSI